MLEQRRGLGLGPAASSLFAIHVNMTNKYFEKAMELSEAFLDGSVRWGEVELFPLTQQ